MSYSVADDWNDAMCPPSSELSLLARSTVATAFHRFSDRIRCSSARSPGCGGCLSTGIVLTYGVFAENGTGTACLRASSCSCIQQERRPVGPVELHHRVQRVPPLLVSRGS